MLRVFISNYPNTKCVAPVRSNINAIFLIYHRWMAKGGILRTQWSTSMICTGVTDAVCESQRFLSSYIFDGSGIAENRPTQ
jgi:hypothetical protein